MQNKDRQNAVIDYDLHKISVSFCKNDISKMHYRYLRNRNSSSKFRSAERRFTQRRNTHERADFSYLTMSAPRSVELEEDGLPGNGGIIVVGGEMDPVGSGREAENDGGRELHDFVFAFALSCFVVCDFVVGTEVVFL